MKLPKSTKIYLGFIFAIGFVLLVFSILDTKFFEDQATLIGVIFFILFGAVMESLPLRVEGDNLVSISDTVSIAVILLFDAPTAVIVRFLGAILAVRRNQNRYTHLFNTPIYKSLFNGFCRGIMVFLGWHAYQFLDGLVPQPVIMNFGLIGLLGLVFVYFTVDQILYAILFSLLAKTSLIHEIDKKLWMFKQLLALAPLGMIFASLYSWQGVLPILFLVGPFLYTRHAIEQTYQTLKEQKKTQEDLRLSEEKFSKAFHASPMAIVIQRGSDRRYIDVNEGFITLTGYSREEALGKTVDELGLYPVKSSLEPNLQELIQEGSTRENEFPFRRKNGEIGYGVGWGEKLEMGGETVYLGGVIDITERKRSEMERTEQAREIKALYEALTTITGKQEDVKSLTKRITEIIVNDFHAHECAIWLLSDDHSQAVKMVSSGSDTIQEQDTLPLDITSLITSVIKTGEAIYLPDVRNDPRYRVGDENTLSEFVVPLRAYGEVIGVINMESPKLDDFSGRTRRLVLAFAQNAALAILNARLLHSLEISFTNIKESQARINFFLEHTSEGVYRIDYDPPIPTTLPFEEQFRLSVQRGRIAECNDAIARMYGFKGREEMLGKPYIDFYGEEGYQANLEGNLQFYRDGYRSDDMETVEFNTAGERVYFSNNVIGIIRDGYFVSTWGSQRDITPLKKALAELEKNLAELKEYQARINFFLEHTKEGVYRIDYDPPIPIDLPYEEQYKLSRERGRFGECNLAIAKMYGYSSKEEMLAAPYYVENEGYEASLKANVELYRSGYRSDDFETDEYTPSGEKAYFLNNAVGIVRDGYFMSIWGTQRDITPLKKALAELEKKNAELERFTYTLWHELKTPLVTMRGFLGYLDGNIKSQKWDRAQSDLLRISQAADKMNLMIIKLLDVLRAGHVINVSESVDFQGILQKSLEPLRDRINEQKIRLVMDSKFPLVSCDRERMVEAIGSLIENSIKFMGDQPAPQITIGIRQENSERVFFVSDNGMGIDPAYHNRIFNIFEKLNPLGEGTGIGLSLAKRIIEMHKGRIWAESEGIGKGSTFCFTLPETKL